MGSRQEKEPSGEALWLVEQAKSYCASGIADVRFGGKADVRNLQLI
jgi:hypothetical protein